MLDTEMTYLDLPKSSNRSSFHHSSEPELPQSDFSTALAAVVAASSATTIAVPQISINRMAYSLSSFNQQFRRLSQLSQLTRARRDLLVRSFTSNTSSRPTSSEFPSGAWLRKRRKALSNCLNACWPLLNLCTTSCSNLTPFALCKRYLPAFQWLSEYQKSDLIPDILAGLTIAVFHVPECMGYSFLVDVNPIYCLYSSFFPTLIYGLMGTSQYCSVGTFAALSIMTGTVIKDTKLALHREAMLRHSEILDQSTALFGNQSSTSLDALALTNATADHHLVAELVTFQNEDIAFVCTFVVGFYLLLVGILRLGFISVYMSEQFLNGFTCAVAYHVLFSQIFHIFGITGVDTESGKFIIFQYLTHIYQHFGQINIASFAISLLTGALILTCKFKVDPWLETHKQLKISFPIEFVVVLLGVVISRGLRLSSTWDVKIIGPIQTGLPEPIVPHIGPLLKHLWQPCISIAVVSYAITYSVGRTFYDQVYDNPKGVSNQVEEKGSKQQQQSESLDSRSWEINPSQELVALGCSNLVSSFFSCIPAGASLSRSAIQFGSGGKTQLVSLINSAAILAILYMSSLFEALPNAILATIISVALRDLLSNVSQFRKYWRVSKVDASVWLVTFLAVMFIDINWGLFLGLLYSLVTLIYKSQLPPANLLGTVGELDNMSSVDFFVPLNQYINARELPGIKIFQFCGPLHFANVDYFFKKLEAKLGISVKDLIKIKTIEINLSNALDYNMARAISTILPSGDQSQSSEEILDEDEDEDEGDLLLSHFACSTNGPFCSTLSLTGPLPAASSLHTANPRTVETIIRRCRRHLKRSLPNYLVIDCSMFSYIDTDGLKMLKRLVKDFDFLDVKVFLGGCPSHVGRLLARSELEQSHESGQVIYISVPDAIEHARQELQDIARTRSIMALNEEVPSYSLPANDPHILEPFSSYSAVDGQFQAAAPSSLLFTSTAEPMSSLFSSITSTVHSIPGDSVLQQLSVPTVLELSPDEDYTSLSIDEEVDSDSQSTVHIQVHDGRPLRLAYFEV